MTTNDGREGYARLPEDLLRDLLEGAGSMMDQVSELLGPVIDARERLRHGLEELGLIHHFNPVEPTTIAAVDGGYAVERTLAIDLSLAVAVGVEGLGPTTTIWDSTQYRWWPKVALHNEDADRLARGITMANEIAILANAPHALRILDGSHLTLVIQLNSALSSQSEYVRAEARRVWGELRTPDGLAEVCRASNIIAMPKYDSSRAITQMLEQHLNMPVPSDDKYLMGLLLEPGELTRLSQVPEDPWTKLHFSPYGDAAVDIALAEDLTRAILPLKQRQVMYTYFKPDQYSTAFRIEMKSGATEKELNLLCSTLSDQITGPFVREPYPQYLADVIAKSVGIGLNALQTAVQLGLSRMERPEISKLLVQSYRTEGK